MEAKDLNNLFQKAEQADRSDFAKMRSSLLLIAGEHYNNKGSKFWDRVRTTKEFSNEIKLRLTKNHIGRIARRYSNIIVSSAPGVTVSPANPRELSDQKAAELSLSIWQHIKDKNDFSERVLAWSDDFVGIGEVVTKVFYDGTYGQVVGYEPQMQGQAMVVDQMGQPVPDEQKPIRQGLVRFEEIYAFNVLRDPAAKNIKTSSWYCIRKMAQVEDLKADYPQKAEGIEASQDETFMVFDASGGYRSSESGEVMVKEWHFRPCKKYPNGKWIIQVGETVLDEGEYPSDEDGVLFPLEFERFESVQTKARGIAITEPLRPLQAEINRCFSKIAEHHVTLGDDKLILVNGSKMSAGAQLSGIRSVSVTGQAPTVLPGRTGEQYLPYMNQTVTDMYDLVELEDEDDNKGNLDPHTLLYKAASHKKRFRRYVQKFEHYLIRVAKLALRTARAFMPDESVVIAVGRTEAVNIAEFKGTHSQAVSVKIEAQAEDVETKLGRQLVFNHILQYVGTQLDPSDIGKIVKMMPYANVEESFSDLTMDYEIATNDILALDRGEMPQIGQYDPHDYIVKRVTQRMKQPDFKFLSPEIQAMYQEYLSQHMAIMSENAQAVQRANAGLIPSGGTLVGVDYFVQDPNNPERTRRARLPYDAIDWLAKKLEEQAGVMSSQMSMPEEVQASIAGMSQQQPMQAEADPLSALGPMGASSGEMTDPLAALVS